MKECDIVQDLLIGYNDKTLRDGSKEFVDNHLNECENCKKLFEEIKNDDIEENENSEIDYLKKINKKDSKKTKCIIILLILVAIVVLVNCIVFITYYNTDAGMEIFLNDDISDENFNKIESIIKESHYEYKFVSKEEALEKFKERLSGDGQKVLEGYSPENNIFPASFIVKSGWGIEEDLISSLENIEGIKKMTSSTKINPYVLFYAKIRMFIDDNLRTFNNTEVTYE